MQREEVFRREPSALYILFSPISVYRIIVLAALDCICLFKAMSSWQASRATLRLLRQVRQHGALEDARPKGHITKPSRLRRPAGRSSTDSFPSSTVSQGTLLWKAGGVLLLPCLDLNDEICRFIRIWSSCGPIEVSHG